MVGVERLHQPSLPAQDAPQLLLHVEAQAEELGQVFQQPQRFAIVVDGQGRLVLLGRPPRGQIIEPRRLGRQPGALVVLGNGRGVIGQALAAVCFQPARGLQVIARPVAQQDALVGHFAQDGVFEQVGLAAAEDGRRRAVDHVAPLQRLECSADLLVVKGVARRAVDLLHGAVPELVAHDGGLLQSQPFQFRQPVETGLQDARQRRRDAQVGQFAPPQLPGRRAGNDDADLNEHTHQFLDIEGVARGRLDDEVQQRGRDVGQFAQNLQHQFAAMDLAQRGEEQGGRGCALGGPGRPPLEQHRPGQADHQQRRAGRQRR